MVEPGLLVALEGGDGVGKSTQARRLAAHLRAAGHDVVLTHEPGDNAIGAVVRALVLEHGALDSGAAGLDPRTEALLYAADRAQHVAQVVRPALTRGAVVVTDRYVDSSIAYQGVGRGLGTAEVAAVSHIATGGLVPDLTVLLDLEPDRALARVGEADRIEAEPAGFHERVRAEFRRLAETGAQRGASYVVVDAGGSEDAVAADVIAAVERVIAAHSAAELGAAAGAPDTGGTRVLDAEREADRGALDRGRTP